MIDDMMSLAFVGGLVTDCPPNGLLAAQSVAISPVSPVYDHHQQHQLEGTAVAAARQVDFICASPAMMSAGLELGGDDGNSPVDEVGGVGRVMTSYAAQQPTPLDAFCSLPSYSMSTPVCAPLLGVGVADDRPPSNATSVQLIDCVPLPARAAAADCGVPLYGHLPLRPPGAAADVYRPMTGAATADPFAAGVGDMFRAFSVPPLKSELI